MRFTLWRASLLFTFAAACPATSTTAEPAPAPPAPAPATGAPPMPAASSPAADNANQLASALLALDGSPRALPLPAAAWARLDPPDVSRPTLAVDGEGGALTLAITRRDGSWEPPRGNGRLRADDPIVDGVEFTGPGALQLELPKDAVPLRVRKAPGLANIERQDDSAVVEVLTFVRGSHRFYVERGDATRPFYVARFFGRAPFHVDDGEVRALEQQLLALAKAMAHSDPFGTAAADHLAAHHASSRQQTPPPPSTARALNPAAARPRVTYDLGLASLTLITPNVVEVQLRAPVTLPGFFRALDMREVRTHFAHDAGDIPDAVVGQGVQVNLGSYAILRPFSTSFESGPVAQARLRSFTLSSATPTR